MLARVGLEKVAGKVSDEGAGGQPAGAVSSLESRVIRYRSLNPPSSRKHPESGLLQQLKRSHRHLAGHPIPAPTRHYHSKTSKGHLLHLVKSLWALIFLPLSEPKRWTTTERSSPRRSSRRDSQTSSLPVLNQRLQRQRSRLRHQSGELRVDMRRSSSHHSTPKSTNFLATSAGT